MKSIFIYRRSGIIASLLIAAAILHVVRARPGAERRRMAGEKRYRNQASASAGRAADEGAAQFEPPPRQARRTRLRRNPHIQPRDLEEDFYNNIFEHMSMASQLSYPDNPVDSHSSSSPTQAPAATPSPASTLPKDGPAAIPSTLASDSSAKPVEIVTDFPSFAPPTNAPSAPRPFAAPVVAMPNILPSSPTYGPSANPSPLSLDSVKPVEIIIDENETYCASREDGSTHQSNVTVDIMYQYELITIPEYNLTSSLSDLEASIRDFMAEFLLGCTKSTAEKAKRSLVTQQVAQVGESLRSSGKAFLGHGRKLNIIGFSSEEIRDVPSSDNPCQRAPEDDSICTVIDGGVRLYLSEDVSDEMRQERRDQAFETIKSYFASDDLLNVSKGLIGANFIGEIESSSEPYPATAAGQEHLNPRSNRPGLSIVGIVFVTVGIVAVVLIILFATKQKEHVTIVGMERLDTSNSYESESSLNHENVYHSTGEFGEEGSYSTDSPDFVDFSGNSGMSYFDDFNSKDSDAAVMVVEDKQKMTKGLRKMVQDVHYCSSGTCLTCSKNMNPLFVPVGVPNAGNSNSDRWKETPSN